LKGKGKGDVVGMQLVSADIQQQALQQVISIHIKYYI
jgi:hypothetical protein